ncbi:DUF6355 family natural product biosynthesis protein [Amycolatopsis silviterrae]|uniref:DUF6355 family natural product biosynthesis protein n=1 Tax=Amycolatopsis silviterrae TaxID=1656914 RepID=A0ABW5HBU1_9PSEU
MRMFSALSAGVLTAAAMMVSGPVATASTQQFPCGFYESGGLAYYGHCDEPPRTDVTITVDMAFPSDDWHMCVKPGVTVLGAAGLIDGAFYSGNICDAG